MAGYWPNSFSRGAAKMSDKELEREISGRNFLRRTCLPLRQGDSPSDIFEGNKRSSRSRRRNRQKIPPIFLREISGRLEAAGETTGNFPSAGGVYQETASD